MTGAFYGVIDALKPWKNCKNVPFSPDWRQNKEDSAINKLFAISIFKTHHVCFLAVTFNDDVKDNQVDSANFFTDAIDW